MTLTPTEIQEDDVIFDDDELTRRERIARVWRWFGQDVQRRRGRLTAGMGFAILLGLARVAEPWPLKIVFDQVLFHRPARGAFTRAFLVFGPRPTDILWAAAIVLMTTGIVHGFAYYYQDYMLASAAQETVYAIRTRLYRHLHRLDLGFHLTRHVGDTLVRLSTDIIMLRDVLIDMIVTLGSGLVMLVLMLIVMVVVDPVLTVLAVATMPVVFLLTYVYGDQIRIRSRKQRKREGDVAALMHESLAAMAVVQLNTAEQREEERFRDANKRSLRQGVKTIRLEARMNRAVEVSLAFGMVIVLWAGTTRALHNHLSPGELVVFISYLRAAYRPLRRASKTVQRSAKALAAAERIVEVLAIEPAVQDAPGAIAAPRFNHTLCLEQVHFAYGGGEEVLHGIDLVIESGHSIALVGTTGSGKSTLLALLPRLYDVTAGQVSLDGHDVRDLTVRSLRDQFAVVQQEAVLMGLTIAENIRYGAPERTDEQVLEAALAAGLGPVLAHMHDGLDTVVAERGASLSGGERQRVTIARAIARDAPILLLDEPTTGLDPRTRREVADTLLELMAERTVVLVTHDLEFAARADEIVVLADGAIAARGRYEDLIRDSVEFRRLADRLAVEQG